jgi:hypothetical protein
MVKSVMTIKSGQQTTGIVLYGQMSHTVPYIRMSLHWKTPDPECLVPTVKHMGGSMMVLEVISWYSVDPIIILYGRITVREDFAKLSNQVHPMI